MPAKPIRAAILASGSGTNAENILSFEADNGRLDIRCVICNKDGAGVIARAEKFGVPCHIVPVMRDGFDSFKQARLAQEEKVLALLQAEQVEWIFLAGYMQIISPAFLACFADADLGVNKVVNIHPSLLPQFPGKDGYGDAWRAGVKTSGVTLHYVDEGVDTGPVIAQRSFDRHDDDTFEDFRARGMALEYEVYREFLAVLISDDVPLRRQGPSKGDCLGSLPALGRGQ